MKNKGQFRVAKRTQKDYSLAFKMQVVDEIEKGELSQHGACRKYGIQARSTVLTWLRKHGRLDWWKNSTDPMPRKSPPNKKIKELEKQLKRLQAQNEILNTAIDIADHNLNTSIRKKYLSLLSEATQVHQAPLPEQNKNDSALHSSQPPSDSADSTTTST